jgi:hypothetical protein
MDSLVQHAQNQNGKVAESAAEVVTAVINRRFRTLEAELAVQIVRSRRAMIFASASSWIAILMFCYAIVVTR